MIFRKKYSKLFFIFSFCSLILLSLENKNVYAAATHIVISQIQVSGNTANDEFVELFNPTDTSVDLSGYKLKRKTAAGSESNLVSSMSGIINAHSYFLVAHPEFSGSTTKDYIYTSTSSGIAANNTVLLYNSVDTVAIDKVGMGTATDFEGAAASVPSALKSIQRKLDEQNAHALDTDNNVSDFELLEPSFARNSLVIVGSPSPSITPTATASMSPSPTPTSSASPTLTPTATPTVSPSSSPTQSPSSTPSPTLTTSPTSTASATPTLTPHPTVTPKPTVPPFQDSVIGIFNFPGYKVECKIKYLPIIRRFFFGFFPSIKCTRV